MNGTAELDGTLKLVPTPIAAPALACLHAVTAGELASALSFLHSCVHGFLHAAAWARLRHGHAAPLECRPAFTRAWQWGDPETVVRLHAHLDRLGGGKPGAWVVGFPWPDTLAGLVSEAGEPSDRAITPSARHALEIGLRELLATRLACTHGWTLFHLATVAAGEPVLVFRGPLPAWRSVPFAWPAHSESGLHLHADDETFSIQPFCRRGRPDFAPTARGKTARQSGRPTLHVIAAVEEGRYSEALPEIGLIRHRNDRLEILWDGARCAGVETWGVMLLRIGRMRELNDRFGYAAGDRLVSAMDASAGRFAWEPRALQGMFTAFPFWRRGGELLIPFRTHGDHGLPATASGALELAAEIIGATYAATHEAGMNPEIQVAIRLNVGVSEPGRPASKRLQHELLAASEALRHDLSALGAAPEAGTVWRLDCGDGSAIATRRDRPFTRVSRAAFGLIRRDRRGASEYLLRFNARHGRYNFVGGHMEPEDGDSPLQTLARELREELALAQESYTATPIFAGPLHHLAFSSPHRAHTLYVHHFFTIAGLADAALATLTHPDCRWFPAEPLFQQQCAEVSPDPLTALATRWNPLSANAPTLSGQAEALRLLFGFG